MIHVLDIYYLKIQKWKFKANISNLCGCLIPLGLPAKVGHIDVTNIEMYLILFFLKNVSDLNPAKRTCKIDMHGAKVYKSTLKR
jgi:hypothetical protein